MTNSTDPDQFLLQKPTDLDLHCCKGKAYLDSAGPGLKQQSQIEILYVNVLSNERNPELIDKLS